VVASEGPNLIEHAGYLNDSIASSAGRSMIGRNTWRRSSANQKLCAIAPLAAFPEALFDGLHALRLPREPVSYVERYGARRAQEARFGMIPSESLW